MNILDGLIVGALFFGALRGLKRGLTRSILGLAGLVLGLILAARLYRPLGEYLERQYETIARLSERLAPHLPLSSTVSTAPIGDGTGLVGAVEGLALPEIISGYLVSGAEGLAVPTGAATVGEALSLLLASSLVGVLCFVGIFLVVQLAAGILSFVIGGAISATPLVIVDRLSGLVLGAAYAAITLTVLLGGLSLLAAVPAFAFLGSGLDESTLAPVFLSFFQLLLPRVPVLIPTG